MPDRYLTIRQVAERRGVSPSTHWRHVAQGLFPKGLKLGGKTFWIESDVEQERRALLSRRNDNA